MSGTIRFTGIKNFDVRFDNDEMLITPKHEQQEVIIAPDVRVYERPTVYISETKFRKLDVGGSRIMLCYIRNEDETFVIECKKYQTVLYEIFRGMGRGMGRNNVIKSSTFNIIKTERKGFNWISELDVYVPSRNPTQLMREILKMVSLNDLIIDMSIELKNMEVVNYKNY